MNDSQIAMMVLGAVAIIAVTILLEEVFSRALIGLARRSGAKQSTLRGIRYFARVTWILVVAVSVLYYTGLASVFTTLTVGGIAGVAVSLALQSTLSNMISGILLLQDKAIRLDDEIVFGGVRGRVVQIALRNTWIRTPEGNLVLISNSSLAAGPLTNLTATPRLKGLLE
jgi:small-conductance mechanosensitive channel